MSEPLAQPTIGPDEPSWLTASLDELTDYVTTTLHRTLRRELLSMVALAEALERAADADAPRGLASRLRQLAERLIEHMSEEERVVFPMIQCGHGPLLDGAVMDLVRQWHAEDLASVADLAEHVLCSDSASFAWRALCHQLCAFERTLAEQVYLEDHIVFPRAITDDHGA